MSSFMRLKFEKEAAKHWNRFYKQNQANFFKDRHYLEKEFDCLSQSSPAQDDSATKQNRNLLEVGCGVGNTVYPLLESHGDLYVHCCDFSQEAVRLVKEHDKYEQGKRVNAFVCDARRFARERSRTNRRPRHAHLCFVGHPAAQAWWCDRERCQDAAAGSAGSRQGLRFRRPRGGAPRKQARQLEEARRGVLH